ncbi:Histidine kinase-like ATPase domain protein [Leptospira interrogans serovar Manilae]|uniref:Histidine kinase-like ATPase domain protein n=1 Tax=Leptospira interrogans serovar Manilae TaxID=214675 RepID=A0AAQ1P1V9_LEPIR|nr:ATP-binding protein [Leptospira interrogans]AKP25749.1 anti-sigma factor antagonist [Leptospira interrogans serovar Manilae]AKP29535.1 anti-sigma factor antagonist [Leptospira interrogans serovar Manilae]EMJ51951.1 histidine kinase-like ATPase domain protein [Leptospira interrogans serovar Valbuzzi str. Duyster]ENO71809.1 histidine kinase-like ATPase domain protein [Leptospira interrogans serovar Valbuzzi str. Valbuzzi]EYU64622.1 anti-sigma factor antagonist [Leptospira interrogans serovar 
MDSGKKKNLDNLFRLQIPSHPRYLSIVRSLVYNLAFENGFTASDSADLKLAVGECLLNVIKHSYEGKKNLPIFLEISLFDNRIEIRIRDFGNQKNLSEIRGYEPSDYREEGIGLYLVKKLTDHFYLDQSLPEGNRLILTKLK